METDFSDWLVSEDGITLLAEELGIEIENLVRESRPGDFRCDIKGNLLGDENSIVVIENQFGRTNHDHLGKLFTYAAVHRAMTGIWIAENISDDHRQVIDWLNENTPTSVSFYLVGLKLYQYGEGLVVPQLDVVCRPNLAVKPPTKGPSEAAQERRDWHRTMWTDIHEAIQRTNPPFRLQKPGESSYLSIFIGRSGFSLNMYLTPRTPSIGIDLYINARWKQQAFEILETQREAIESELGAPMQWIPPLETRAARVLLEAKIDPRKPENEADVRAWFAANLIRMFRVFQPRVAALVAPEADE